MVTKGIKGNYGEAFQLERVSLGFVGVRGIFWRFSGRFGGFFKSAFVD